MKSSDYLLLLSCMTFSSTKTKLKSMLNAASLKAVIVRHFFYALTRKIQLIKMHGLKSSYTQCPNSFRLSGKEVL